jgi:hypothetical protein
MREPQSRTRPPPRPMSRSSQGPKIFSVVGVDLVDLGVKADPKRRQMGVFACIGAGGG